MEKPELKISQLPMKTLLVCLFIFLVFSCSKKEDTETPQEVTRFTLSSPVIGADSLLPADYTCDGDTSTLPLQWSGFPSETKWFALIMDHLTPDNTIKWYWVMYDIPLTVTSLPKNVTGIGSLGTNSVNDRNEYAPPCSQGPGKKYYTLTLYALSEQVVIDLPPEQINREALLSAIKDITISTASMTVVYSRNVK